MIKKEADKFESSDILEGMSSISSLFKGIEAGTNNRKVQKIIFDESKKTSKRRELSFLKAKASQYSFNIEFANAEEIEKITVGNTHGGIVAICSSREIPLLKPENISDNGCYFILEGVEDPYNFGYAIRSIFASGANGIILGERNWMGTAGIVARSSAGASELIDMYISEPVNAIRIFKDKGYSVICAGIRDSVSIFETELTKPLLIVLGGEKRGISRAVLDLADRNVRIDYGTQFGGSLSTSAAAAVFGFEVYRANLKK